ncbi:MAG: HAMP domain-containing histidine kinase [Elusimicrobia bacterium]|nr:HAMP domain-containing histidine kinase [Elusimicrobiota bacterium]
MSTHERVAELKDRLDAKTRLMQDVAHELKNPLSVILGYAHYLTKETVSPEETRKALRAVLSNAERLVGMVDHLQEVVRLESDGFNVETRTIEGSTLLQEAAESAELEAARHGVRLRWRSPVGDSLLVNADSRRVLQVFANLLSNALKFTPEGGSIDVTAQRDGDFVRFTVLDTGAGIPADELPMLFDRFYQTTDNTQKRKGLGLGLAICKGLVTAHGGRIWVESLPGVGSAFNFTLPAVLTSTPSSR